ncbi:hypothetical protein F3J29_18055 [Enterobacter sp. Cy-643]|nr:hypothetical protein [Enterobacter sp. Cy-643]
MDSGNPTAYANSVKRCSVCCYAMNLRFTGSASMCGKCEPVRLCDASTAQRETYSNGLHWGGASISSNILHYGAVTLSPAF